MNGKTLGTAVVGILVGVAIGYVIWGQAQAPQPDTPHPTPRTAPKPPPTPGDWPEVPCPGTTPPMTVADACEQIVHLATTAPPGTNTHDCAAQAQRVMLSSPMPWEPAATHVSNALNAAQRMDWAACRNELDQIE